MQCYNTIIYKIYDSSLQYNLNYLNLGLGTVILIIQYYLIDSTKMLEGVFEPRLPVTVKTCAATCTERSAPGT